MKKIIVFIASLLTITSFASANNDALWGALLGGVIGNQIGSSDHNQYIGAAIGAILLGTDNNVNYGNVYSHGQNNHYRQTGYYTYVTRQIYIEPIYGYTSRGEQIIVRQGYYKTIRERVWVP